MTNGTHGNRDSETPARFGLAVLSCLLLAGCATQPSRSPAAAGTETVVEVARVTAGPLDVTMDLPGELQPYEAVAIYPRVTGFVKSIAVDRGSSVRRGEAIVELDAPELGAERSAAESKLRSAQAQLAAAQSKAAADQSTYERLKAASVTPGVVAGNDLMLAEKAVERDRAEATAVQDDVEAAREAVRSLADTEAYLHVTAPFDGVVVERNVHPGALVGPGGGSGAGTPIVRIVALARLRLVVAVPEAYVSNIPEGSMMTFTVPAYPGEAFTARVARVAHAVDLKTRTMPVELDVDNSSERVAPGSFCRVRWRVTRSRPSLFVLSTSVASTTERVFVVRVRNGVADWVDVLTGLAKGPLVEVFGDLQDGDQVAARGTDELRPGTRVQVKDARPRA